MDLNSILDTAIAAASCPGLQDLAVKGAVALALIVSLINSRKINRIANTAVLKDHLRKKK